MSFVIGILVGLSIGAVMFVLQRRDLRRAENIVTALKNESERDFNRWWEERHKLNTLLGRAGYFLLGNYDVCGRPLADPRSEQDKIVSAIGDTGAMGPRGSVGPSKVPT